MSKYDGNWELMLINNETNVTSQFNYFLRPLIDLELQITSQWSTKI